MPHLVSAFEAVYGGKVQTIDFEELKKRPEVVELYNKYSSDEWLYGKWRNFTAQRSGQFDWGSVDISLTVDEQRGIITDIAVATDALEVEIVDKIRNMFIGNSSFKRPDLPEDSTVKGIANDLLSLIY